MQKLEFELKFSLEFKFAQLDKFLKIKLDSGSICEYEKLKLWHFCEIYLTVHDSNHEPDFCDRIPNEKNQGSNLTWSVTISGQNFVKHIFVAINLSKNKVPSSF